MEIKLHGVLLELGDEPLEFSGIRAARRRLLYSSASPTRVKQPCSSTLLDRSS